MGAAKCIAHQVHSTISIADAWDQNSDYGWEIGGWSFSREIVEIAIDI